MIQLPTAKAYIFDMDGTLTDNMHFHHEAWMKFIALKKLGVDSATFERDYHKGTLIEVMARFFPHLTTKAELRAVGNEKEALYRDTYGHLLEPLPGLHLFLEQLKAKNIPLGLATMGDQNNLEGNGRFRILRCQNQAQLKKDFNLFIQALKSLQRMV